MELRSVEAIVRALNTAGVKYLIVGGLAVNAHGFMRYTDDVDIVLALEPVNVTRGLRTLEQIGYRPTVPARIEDFADREIRESWRRDKHMIVFKLWSDEHRRTPIDIFVYEPFDFHAEVANAHFEQVSSGIAAPVISFQTLLQMKREAGRPRDLIDIEELQRGR